MRLGAAAALLAVLTAGCGSDERVQSPRQAAASPAAGREPSRAPAPRASTPAPVPARARARARAMTVSERVAQIMLVDFEGTDLQTPDLPRLQARGWGGIVLDSDDYVEPGQLAALGGEARVLAELGGHPAPLVAAAQEGGAASAFPDLPPRAQAELGIEGSARAVKDEARQAAEQLRAAGVNTVLAPVADVAVSAGPLGDRPYGDDPRLVARLAAAAVQGWSAGRVIPVPKHFPGQGAASQNPLEGPATVGLTRAALEDRDLLPFRALIGRAPAVMVSSAAYAAYDGVTPAAANRDLVGGLLRGDLGFDGVAVSDDLAGIAAAMGGTAGDAAVAAVAAGTDLVLVGDRGEIGRVHAALVRALERGELAAGRLEEAAGRVLALKRRFGIGWGTAGT